MTSRPTHVTLETQHMAASLHNLTGVPVTFGIQTLSPAAEPILCTNPLPAPISHSFFLVPACMAAAGHTRGDVLWSASIPNCADCAPAPGKRKWFARLAQRQAQNPILRVIEHYTPEDGRQGVGVELFRQRYLQ